MVSYRRTWISAGLRDGDKIFRPATPPTALRRRVGGCGAMWPPSMSSTSCSHLLFERALLPSLCWKSGHKSCWVSPSLVMFSEPAKSAPNPALQDFTNVFVLSSEPSSKHGLLEVPKALEVDPLRQRRAHQKSRSGCDNCRRRRVKVRTSSPPADYE